MNTETSQIPSPIPVSQIERFSWSENQQQEFLRGDCKLYPDGAAHWLSIEIAWIPDTDEPRAEPPSMQEVIKLLDKPGNVCPMCKDAKRVFRNYKGKKTGLRVWFTYKCNCNGCARFYRKWINSDFVEPNYRNVNIQTLPKLRPYFHNFSDAQFEDLLNVAHTAERNCMLLTGPAGTGKSVFMTALFSKYLLRWAEHELVRDSVWKIPASQLAKQNRAFELRSEGNYAPRPLVDAQQIKWLERDEVKLTPYLFLEELDKIKLDSEFQAREFFDLINAIHSHEGVVVATTNKSPQRLIQALGEEFGEPIIRRLIGPRTNTDTPDDPTNPEKNGILIDFGTGTITRSGCKAQTPSEVNKQEPQRPPVVSRSVSF